MERTPTKIVPIDSPQFGCVMAVFISPMMVGTHQDDGAGGRVCAAWAGVLDTSHLVRFRYFPVERFLVTNFCGIGGSTIVLLFEKGKVG